MPWLNSSLMFPNDWIVHNQKRAEVYSTLASISAYTQVGIHSDLSVCSSQDIPMLDFSPSCPPPFPPWATLSRRLRPSHLAEYWSRSATLPNSTSMISESWRFPLRFCRFPWQQVRCATLLLHLQLDILWVHVGMEMNRNTHEPKVSGNHSRTFWKSLDLQSVC